MPEKSFFHIHSQGTLQKVSTLEELLVHLKDGGYAWLDFFDPTEQDLVALKEPFAVHPLSIEDCLDQEQIPKIEDFPANTFILLNGCRYENGQIMLEEADLSFRRYVLQHISVEQHLDELI